MRLMIQMGPDYQRAVASLGAMGQAIEQAVTDGLHKAAKLAAGHVAEGYLSGQALKRRTGRLAASVDGWLESSHTAVVGVRPGTAVDQYKWILGDEERTIRPRQAKFLTIPIGENLTAAGVARYSSPRQVPEGFFVHTGGRLLFGYTRGKRGKFRPLFVLVKEVLVQGSGALYDGVMESLDDMGAAIEAEIAKRLEAA